MQIKDQVKEQMQMTEQIRCFKAVSILFLSGSKSKSDRLYVDAFYKVCEQFPSVCLQWDKQFGEML